MATFPFKMRIVGTGVTVAALLFLVSACSLLVPKPSERMLNGIVLNKHTGVGIPELEIRLFRLKPKVLTMGAWEMIAVTKTNANGAFVFRVDEHGPYEIRWTDVLNRMQFKQIDRIDNQLMRIAIEVDAEKARALPPWVLKP